jgi:hypothetical protein
MKIILLILLSFSFFNSSYSQVTDSTANRRTSASDSAVATDTLRPVTTVVATDTGLVTKKPAKRIHSPRVAAIRSAILPGLGQIYNRKYWKVPIVYAAIGVPASLFFYNKNWYDRVRFALRIVSDSITDPAILAKVHPELSRLVELRAEGSLINSRNQFRRNMDYSVLFTLVMWGLNVVDATVDAHLMGFDVNEDLSLRFTAPPLQNGNTMGVGIAIVFK